MALVGWPACPDAIRDQVSGLVEGVQMLLGSALAGVSLHGSLAFGCFNLAEAGRERLTADTATPVVPALTVRRRSQPGCAVPEALPARPVTDPWQ